MTKKLIKSEIPALNLLSHVPYEHVECNLDLAIEALKPATILKRMGFKKRSGDSVEAIMYSLLLMPLLNVRSLYFLFDNNLNQMLKGGKDVIYSFMQNQSINWPLCVLKISLSFFNLRKWNTTFDDQSSFLVDDTIKESYGEKKEATSLHYDHNKGTSVRGYQVLQLGISNAKGFLPLLAQIFIGSKKRSILSKDFKDKRKAVAKSYNESLTLSKHELLAKMLDKAISFGFSAKYILADAWFICKKNVKLALKHDLIALFMMKRGKQKYLLNGKLYTSKSLYRMFRKDMVKLKGKSFHACAINVDYNLSEDPDKPEWIKIRLVFRRLKSASKNSWVVLLSTDENMELEKILDIYSLRWNIEVYFKEVKQYFGFIKEQSWQYTVCFASVHLAMIRYTLFYYLSLVQSSMKFSDLRNRISMNVMIFSYGILMWQTISQIIDGTLDEYSAQLGKNVTDGIQLDIQNKVHQHLEALWPIKLGITQTEIEKMDLAMKKGEL